MKFFYSNGIKAVAIRLAELELDYIRGCFCVFTADRNSRQHDKTRANGGFN